ncbi:hypothetical protein ECDEC9B_1658 [Escherichia coli DEC9B]|nr:hypothetical protein ECDEC9B_1658 [Escherichia coli DEC9B]
MDTGSGEDDGSVLSWTHSSQVSGSPTPVHPASGSFRIHAE